MLTDVVKEVANALNGGLVAAGLDRVVSKGTNAVLTVSDKIDSLRVPGSMFLGVIGKPV